MTWSFKGLFRRFLEAPDAGAYNELSPSGRGRIRYNNGDQAFEASVDGGPYLPFTTGSAQPPAAVDTIAELSALDDDTFVSGTTIEVNSVIDEFYLDKASTRVVDDITVAATLSGTGRWIRRELASSDWTTQDTWYLDPAAGNDESNGLTPATAVATWAEIRRRWGKIPINQITSVFLLSDVAEALLLDFVTAPEFGGAVLIIGQRTEVAQATIVTATPHATGTFGKLAFGVDVSPYEQLLIEVLDGPQAGATGWHAAPGATVQDALTGQFINSVNSAVFPSNGNTVSFNELTEIASVAVEADCTVGFFDVSVTNALFRGGVENSASIGRSRWLGYVNCMGASTSAFSTPDGIFAASFSGCAFFGRLVGSDNLVQLVDCVVAGTGGVFIRTGGRLRLAGANGFAGKPGANPLLEVEGFASVASVGFANYEASADCIHVYSGGMLRNTGARAWGENITAGGAGNVIHVRAGSMFTYASAPTFAPNEKILTGGVAGTLGASLPALTAANNAAIVVDA